MSPNQLKRIIEAAIMIADNPLSIDQLANLFTAEEAVTPQEIKHILQEITKDYQAHGIELKEVGSGYRFQAQADLSSWLSKLHEERPLRYSRALLETLALIAYRQPITRAEIEDIRGVAVGSNIIKTMVERDWIKVIGHRDLPGKPALYATTKQFLDYFNLKSLEQLPTLAETQNIDALSETLQIQLDIEQVKQEQEVNEIVPEA